MNTHTTPKKKKRWRGADQGVRINERGQAEGGSNEGMRKEGNGRVNKQSNNTG